MDYLIEIKWFEEAEELGDMQGKKRGQQRPRDWHADRTLEGSQPKALQRQNDSSETAEVSKTRHTITRDVQDLKNVASDPCTALELC